MEFQPTLLENAVLPRAGEIHLWRARLDLPAERMAEYLESLSPDEGERAARYRVQPARDHFIASRGMLRTMLARYLETDPALVTFQYGPQGKPCLHEDFPRSDLEFNLAHSGGMGLFAFSRGPRLGVDVEKLHPIPEMETIARRYFAPGEARALFGLPASGRLEAFFHCWTRKEAYIKAIGEGLSRPLDAFEVAFLPDEPPRLVWVAADPQEVRAWSLYSLSPGEGFEGALCAEGSGHRLSFFDL